MKNVLWIVFLVVISIVILMVTMTFMQPEFRKEVGANFLFLQTRPVPVYSYVFAAFIAGILLGSLPLLAAYVGARRDAMRKTGVIRDLENKLLTMKKKEAAEESVRAFSAGLAGQSDKEGA